ncbi:MAG: hydrogenase maturation protease [Anaerolineales bacterium]
MKIKVVGLGQEMAGDDQAGLLIARRWQEQHGRDYASAGVEVQLLESPGINLLGALAGLDAAVLTAAVSSGAPLGHVRQIRGPELDSWRQSAGGGSARGALETLSLGQELIPEDLPGELVLIGIEGAAFTLGEGLSPAVRAAVPQAIAAINQLLDRLIC